MNFPSFIAIAIAIACTAASTIASAQSLPLTEPSEVESSSTNEKSRDDSRIYIVKDAVLRILAERDIPCLTPGVVRKSLVHEGCLVQSGEQVMQIDDGLTKLELEKIKKELRMARSEAATTVDVEYAVSTIQVAEAELGRALRSNQRLAGAVAGSEIDQLALVVEKSNAERKKILFQTDLRKMVTQIRETELAIGQRKLVDHKIKSPIDGIVVEVLKKEGEWVEASESVARVVRLDKLKAEVKIPAAIALDDLLGQPAIFIPRLDNLASKEFEARVVFIHPEANPVNGTVRVWLEIDNSDLELIAGLTGRLEIQRKPALTQLSQPSQPSQTTQ